MVSDHIFLVSFVHCIVCPTLIYGKNEQKKQKKDEQKQKNKVGKTIQ
jgi:hypothetical protein